MSYKLIGVLSLTGLMEFRTNKNQKKATGINITSLVDMMFIILIFMLVSTTFLEQPALDIELPTAKNYGLEDVSEIVLSIRENGSLYLGKEEVKKENLGELLQVYIKKSEKEIPVVLKADKKVDYGLVIEVMDIMHGVGVKKLVALTTHSDDSL